MSSAIAARPRGHGEAVMLEKWTGEYPPVGNIYTGGYRCL